LPTANIDLGFSAYIPKNYIPIDRHRMDVYRKIAVARSAADLHQIEAELSDVYGSIPDETKGLLDLAELRIGAAKWDIRSIVVSQPNPLKAGDVIFSFRTDPGDKAASLFADVKGTIRIADPKTVYLRLTPGYFEPQTLVTVLGKILGEETS
jgi:transcription-repair coupling factor (superfamily II helicase)